MECLNCKYARIATGDMGSENYVSCVSIPDNMNMDKLITYLNEVKYSGRTIGQGWCYHQCPPFTKPNGKMSSGYAIVEANSCCDNFEASQG